MVKIDCNKRQREIYKGTERHRCLHPEAPTNTEIVAVEVCESCPLAGVAKISERHSVSLPILEDSEYPQCPYRYQGTKEHMCSITNLGVTVAICKRCDDTTRVEERKNQAKLGTKALNYFGAVRRWVASGRPTRSPEEIKELFETHCKDCSMYDKEKHACKSCGCNVAAVGDPLDNKLAMKTEACPLGRF